MAISPGGRPADASPVGHGGKNWVTKVGGLPTYIREIAHALLRRGHPESTAIAEAVAAVKRMAAGIGPNGRGHVTGKVQAAAAAAVAEWEAKKAATHLSDLELADAVIAAGKVHDKLGKHYPPKVLGWVKSAKWARKTVPLADIRMHSRPGKPHDQEKVDGIRQAIRSGKKLGPVHLVDTGVGKLRIADGYHRTKALAAEGITHTDAVVAKVRRRRGPWDKAMHDAKLNT